MHQSLSLSLSLVFLAGSYLSCTLANAQITPDGTTSTTVNVDGDRVEINDGDIAGDNLFHSFQDFSVPNGGEASFKNPDTIENIFSRVTGGNISNINGLINANSSANLFLLNPAGIIFGEGARLDIGGSFYGSTADSILFPDDVEFSASNFNPPVLTINAPIGLGFRDNPGEIVNRSQVTDDTGENSIGLRVIEDRTLALIGGDISIEGGLITVPGGRIELGSVAENSTVSLTPIETGFDVGYEEVANFRDLNLSAAASVWTNNSSTADIEVRGGNLNFTENSTIGINPNFEGQAGDININASESLALDADVGFTEVIFSRVSGEATAENGSINIDTPQLNITGAAQIGATNDFGNILGVDININASEIILENPLVTEGFPAITNQVFEEGTGNGGNITISTDTLTLNDGGQIGTGTFGPGNSGDLIVDASQSIELNGTIPDIEDNTPSGLFTFVGIPIFPIPGTGNAGNLTVDTPQLTISNGGQIGTVARNSGNAGNVTLNVSDSILLTGTSPGAELGGKGRSAILLSAESSYEEFITNFDTGEETLTGEIITTTGNGGNLTLNTGSLIIEKGAVISADTFSLGNGGNAEINVEQLILRDGGRIGAGSLLGVEQLDTERGAGGNLNITATESVEITGIGDINGEPVNSSLFTLAQSNGNAGNTNLTTNQLNISNGSDINASAEDLGAAGIISVRADELNLDSGSITAATNAGSGGNLNLEVADRLNLNNNSLISAAATNDANGGNIQIDSEFIIAFPSQNNDIIASAEGGNGGNIKITAEALFGIEERPLNNSSNDINASSEFSLDGSVTINIPDINPVQGVTELPTNVVELEQTTAQACQSNKEALAKGGLNILGKGGMVSEPGMPLNSLNLYPKSESVSTYTIPEPSQTSKGKIQPARGIKQTESGEIILTAYRTNNVGDRLIEPRNCSGV